MGINLVLMISALKEFHSHSIAVLKKTKKHCGQSWNSLCFVIHDITYTVCIHINIWCTVPQEVTPPPDIFEAIKKLLTSFRLDFLISVCLLSHSPAGTPSCIHRLVPPPPFILRKVEQCVSTSFSFLYALFAAGHRTPLQHDAITTILDSFYTVINLDILTFTPNI